MGELLPHSQERWDQGVEWRGKVAATTAMTARCPGGVPCPVPGGLELRAGGLQGLRRAVGEVPGGWTGDDGSSQSVPAVSLVVRGGGGVCSVFSLSPGCFPRISLTALPVLRQLTPFP